MPWQPSPNQTGPVAVAAALRASPGNNCAERAQRAANRRKGALVACLYGTNGDVGGALIVGRSIGLTSLS